MAKYRKKPVVIEAEQFNLGSSIGEPGWFHASISRKDCYPSWEELKRVAALLFPKDAEVMQIVATPHPWVNLHENCFHLWSPIGARLAPRAVVGREGGG